MPSPVRELWGNSIVLVGHFDPTVAQPDALLRQGLIRDEDILKMHVDLLIPDSVAIHFDWLTFSVDRERVAVATTVTNPLPEPARDFALDLLDQMKSPP